MDGFPMDQDIYTKPISNDAPPGVLPVPARVVSSRMRTVKAILRRLDRIRGDRRTRCP